MSDQDRNEAASHLLVSTYFAGSLVDLSISPRQPGDQATLGIERQGLLEIHREASPKPQRLPPPDFRPIGLAMLLSLLGTSVVFVALALYLASLPASSKSLHSDRLDPPYLVRASEVATQQNKLIPLAHTSTRESRSRHQEHQTQPSSTPQPKEREAVLAQARQSGILTGSPREQLASAIQGMTEAADFRLGDDDVARLKGPLPSEIDKLTGAWGHGIRKIGPGSGDGKDWGTIKTKGYRMATSRQGGDTYAAKALSKPHIAESPELSIAQASVIHSGVPYDVIRGQLGLRKRRFRQCLADGLDEDEDWPSLVYVGFQISTSGQVTRPRLEVVKSQGARTCIEDTLRSIEFPEPKDGKVVKVVHFPVRV